MYEYFSKFGEIEQCVIMHDKPSGKSRGKLIKKIIKIIKILYEKYFKVSVLLFSKMKNLWIM
jgi:hypothetical protein